MGLFHRSREDKLENAIWQLKDEADRHTKWGFANSPSEDNYQLKRIEKLAKKVFDLGGDPKEHVSYRYEDQMPEVLDGEIVSG